MSNLEFGFLGFWVFEIWALNLSLKNFGGKFKI